MAVIALILPALFSIVFAILKEQIKLYKITDVKRQGDYALSIMENGVRNVAKEIYTAPLPGGVLMCNTTTASPQANPYFYDDQGNWFRYYLNGNSLARETSTTGSTNITSGSVTISGLSVSCTRSATFSPPIISISYTVTANPVSTRTEERAQMTYQTRIQMRTY